MLLLVCIAVAMLAAALSLAEGIRNHNAEISIVWHYLIPYAFWLGSTIFIQRNIQRKLPNRDPWIFPTTAALTGIGILTIWRLSPDLGLRQSFWYLLGGGLFVLSLNVPELIKTIKNYKYVWLLLGLILIGLTFVVGVNPAGSGEKLWLRVLGIYIQPSEPLKLLLIIYLAAFFADQLRPNNSWINSIFPTLVVVGFAGLLLIAQRDLGTASIFVSLYVLMLSVTTQRRRLLWIIPALALLAGTIGYFAFDVVKTRVDIWLNPWLDTGGSAWQLAQAQIAIASGGITGTGPGLGSPQFVPIAVSDFIFTAIGEELGLLGTSALLLCLLFIVLRGIQIALSGKTTFGRYLAFGISAFFALQSLLIISGNLGLFPLTGVTLPFVSYGGSSLVTNLLAIMLLLKMSTQTSAQPLPESTSSPYRWVAGIIAVLFFLIIAWNGYLAFPNQQELIDKAENPRWGVYDRYSPRGEILALSGEKLVETIGSPGEYQRFTTVPSLSNTLGYAHPAYGMAGLERSQYAYLRGYVGVPWKDRWWHELLYNQPPPGLDLKLNLNLTLQERADSLLGERNGAVVILNAHTGELYAIASHPFFDANQLTQNWATLMERSDAPLLNRAAQGSYPIGTLATTLSLESVWLSQNALQPALNANPRLDRACYQVIQTNDLALTALQAGCRSTSLTYLNAADPELLLNNLSAFGIFTAPGLVIQTSLPPEAPTLGEVNRNPESIMDLKVSPVQMALVAAAISNNGVRPPATLVNAYQNSEGDWIEISDVNPDTEVMAQSMARRIMTELASANQAIWYQSGHALIEANQPLTWLIGGTTPEWSGTPLAIAIAIEEDTPDLAQALGGILLNYSGSN